MTAYVKTPYEVPDTLGPGGELQPTITVAKANKGEEGIRVAQGAADAAQADITSLTSTVAAKAPLASPALTGVPTAPDPPTLSTETGQIATTNWVIDLLRSVGINIGPGAPVGGGAIVWKADAEKTMAEEWASSSTIPAYVSPPNPDATRLAKSSFRNQGTQSYRFELRNGDFSEGNRAELGQALPTGPAYADRVFLEGQERWISFQVYVDPTWPTDNTWMTVMQMKPITAGGGGPNIGLSFGFASKVYPYGASSTWGSTATTYSDGNGPLSGGSFALVKGAWLKFTYHVKFSADAAVGFVEIFADLADGLGMRTIAPFVNRPTMKVLNGVADSSHLRVGIYRDPAIAGTGIVYYDGVTVATTRGAAEGNAFAPINPSGNVTVRTFDGVDDSITTSIGACNLTGAFTIGGAFQRKTNATADTIMANRLAADGNGLYLHINSANDLCIGHNGGLLVGATNPSVVVADGLTLYFVTKAAGTVTPRLHVLRSTSAEAVWLHENFVGTFPNIASQAGGVVRFGARSSAASDPAAIDLATAAEWTSALTDAQVESLAGPLTAWQALSPQGLWRFNQAATTDPVLDLTTGGANQTAITGTAVTTNAVVPWGT